MVEIKKIKLNVGGRAWGNNGGCCEEFFFFFDDNYIQIDKVDSITIIVIMMDLYVIDSM